MLFSLGCAVGSQGLRPASTLELCLRCRSTFLTYSVNEGMPTWWAGISRQAGCAGAPPVAREAADSAGGLAPGRSGSRSRQHVRRRAALMGTACSGAVRTAMTARLSLAPASVVLRLGGHLVHAIAA